MNIQIDKLPFLSNSNMSRNAPRQKRVVKKVEQLEYTLAIIFQQTVPEKKIEVELEKKNNKNKIK